MICPKCNKEAPWVENKEKYGRNFGESYMCYYCKTCDTYVGCHNNTRTPLGTMADKETRRLRKMAHANFYLLWKNGKYGRIEAYRLLAKSMNKDVVHIGESDIETCNQIIHHTNLIK